jgi:chromosome segregation ATPase
MTLKAKEESEELHQRLKKLQGEQASAANDIKREQLKNDQLRKDLRDVQENCEQKGRLIPELELKVKRLEQDSSKLRERLAGKETLSNEQAVELTKLQEQLAELNSAAERNERSLTLTREQALEAKQAATTAEEQQALLRAQHELLQAAHEKKKAEAAVLADKFTKADAACQVLQQRLRESGKDPEASLELRPLKDVQRAAGVHDTLRPMPNIQVLNELNATIVDFQEKLKEPRTVIKKMHEVTILEVDDSLPPEEEPAPARSGAGQLLTSRPVSRGGDLSGRPVSRGGQPAGSVSPRPVSRVGSSRLSRPVSRGDAKGLGLGPLGDARPLTPGSPRGEGE